MTPSSSAEPPGRGTKMGSHGKTPAGAHVVSTAPLVRLALLMPVNHGWPACQHDVPRHVQSMSR